MPLNKDTTKGGNDGNQWSDDVACDRATKSLNKSCATNGMAPMGGEGE